MRQHKRKEEKKKHTHKIIIVSSEKSSSRSPSQQRSWYRDHIKLNTLECGTKEENRNVEGKARMKKIKGIG